MTADYVTSLMGAGSVSFDYQYLQASYSGGGYAARGGSPANPGVDQTGGGGGGGGAPPNEPYWSSNYLEGGNGANGQVDIFYLDIPVVSGGASVLTHPYGQSTSTPAFTATGGNKPLYMQTDANSSVTYSWSVVGPDGSPVSGLSINGSGVLTAGPSMGEIGRAHV